MIYREAATIRADPWTGRTLLTVGAVAVGLVLVGDRFPGWAYGTLVLILLYLLLTNAGAASRTIDYITNPRS